MEPFRINILGCGSALPTLRHYNSSQVVEVRGKLFMIDCGEGTQMQLRKSHIKFTKLSAVFISHIHGDHCFGLIGMISTFGMLGRTAPLHVYAPKELENMLAAQIKMFCPHLTFEVPFHVVDTKKSYDIYDDRSVTVTTIPLEHRMPCCGFLFREKPTLPHIRRDMLDFYEIPISQINNIKNGASWTMPDGEVIPNDKLTEPAEPARSYAYCSDTRYMPKLHELIKGVNLVYHESTYSDENIARAEKYFHSTARQAATVARDAGAGMLLLGHYSARYDNESLLLDEARDVFPRTYLSAEGDIIEIQE